MRYWGFVCICLAVLSIGGVFVSLAQENDIRALWMMFGGIQAISGILLVMASFSQSAMEEIIKKTKREEN